jgi:hypothetical protein
VFEQAGREFVELLEREALARRKARSGKRKTRSGPPTFQRLAFGLARRLRDLVQDPADLDGRLRDLHAGLAVSAAAVGLPLLVFADLLAQFRRQWARVKTPESGDVLALAAAWASANPVDLPGHTLLSRLVLGVALYLDRQRPGGWFPFPTGNVGKALDAEKSSVAYVLGRLRAAGLVVWRDGGTYHKPQLTTPGKAREYRLADGLRELLQGGPAAPPAASCDPPPQPDPPRNSAPRAGPGTNGAATPPERASPWRLL